MSILLATESTMFRVGKDLYLSNSYTRIVERYHRNFGDIYIVTRVVDKTVEQLPTSYEKVTHLIWKYLAIPNLKSFMTGKYDGKIREAIKETEIVSARVPSVIAYRAADIARIIKVPYIAEVVGCPWDSYWNYSLFGKIVAGPAYLMMKKCVGKANYAMYVTEKFLQKRYPCNCPNINCSNVFIEECSEDVLDSRLRKIAQRSYEKKVILMTAASVAVAYKGHEYVIRAIPILKEQGIEVEYRMAGTGDPARLRGIAEEVGASNNVIFLGGLQHDEVLHQMDEADIYIQPSLQEGLPRSVIEAMSRACPAIGARTAGIPELIDDDCVVKQASAEDIARCVKKMCSMDISKFAKRNFEKSKEFLSTVLEERRNTFYQEIIKDLKG